LQMLERWDPTAQGRYFRLSRIEAGADVIKTGYDRIDMATSSLFYLK
jgi:hypothetical protein